MKQTQSCIKLSESITLRVTEFIFGHQLLVILQQSNCSYKIFIIQITQCSFSAGYSNCKKMIHLGAYRALALFKVPSRPQPDVSERNHRISELRCEIARIASGPSECEANATPKKKLQLLSNFFLRLPINSFDLLKVQPMTNFQQIFHYVET